MALGPGKYDHIATQARNAARARGVVVIVFDGSEGSGFSVQADQPMTRALPFILRDLAARIDADLAALGDDAA
jgi:hypothetical protein